MTPLRGARSLYLNSTEGAFLELNTWDSLLYDLRVNVDKDLFTPAAQAFRLLASYIRETAR
jgi:hypothetical protein